MSGDTGNPAAPAAPTTVAAAASAAGAGVSTDAGSSAAPASTSANDSRPSSTLGLTLSGPWQERIERLSERLNPIVVKEIRQGLRTKIFWVCFGLMLLSCFVISLVAYGSSLDGTMTEAGESFFFGYFVCLGLVHFFIIPYSAYRSLAREREEETWVLLSLTGIGARRIIRGKLGSFLAQALLYGSAVLPFLLFSYYLNGIDLPTILTVIALGAAYLVFLTCISVCAATLADSRLMRGLVHFLLLGLLLFGTGLGLTIAGGVTFEQARFDKEFQVAVIAGLWLMLTFGYLMYQAAAARLALPTEDYARGPRLALLVQVIGSIALLVWGWKEEGYEHELAMVAQAVLLFDLFVVGAFLFAGVESVHEVHYRKKGWSLLRPGSVRAFRFVLLLIAATTALWTILYSYSADLPSNPEPGMYFILAAASYVVMYLALPIVVARVTGIWVLNTAAGLRTLTLAIAVAGAGVPPLIGLVLGMKPDDKLLNLFNPVVGLVNFGDRPWGENYAMGVDLLAVVVGAAVLLALAAERMLTWREQESRRAHTDAGKLAAAGS